MRQVSSFLAFVRRLLLSSCVICSAPLAAQQSQATTPNICSLTGTVTEANSHSRLDGVRLELDSATGPTIGTVFSKANGTFEIYNIIAGNYILVADKAGYQAVSQRVDLIISNSTIEIELPKIEDSATPVNQGASTVSARDLSIPSKAHDDMAKGIALLYGKSDYQGSLKLFEKAIQEYPDYYEAYGQIGVAYMKLANTSDSEKAFKKSIEVSREKYQDGYTGLAELYLNGQRFADAEAASRSAVEIDPNSWRAQSELARALVKLHRASEAETSAIAAVSLKADDATLYLILANIHIQLQNDRALLDDLNHYLKLAPEGSFAPQARQERDAIQNGVAASQSSSSPQP